MNLSQTKAMLARFQIRPTHSLGQNFLIDEQAVSRIADLAQISPEDLILEIGPGMGHLTIELARRAGQVIAIEIDHHILPALQDHLHDLPQVQVIEGDALQTDLRSLLVNCQRPVKVVANLPYYVTTDLLQKILLEVTGFKGIYLMMQKEAADRIMGDVGSRDYSPVGVIARTVGSMKKVLTVGRSSFYPQPHVDSVILQLLPVSMPEIQSKDLAGFARFVQSCFRQRRKTLTNSFSWQAAGIQAPTTAGVIAQALAEQGLSPTIRAEAMNPAQFAKLYTSILAISKSI